MCKFVVPNVGLCGLAARMIYCKGIAEDKADCPYWATKPQTFVRKVKE